MSIFITRRLLEKCFDYDVLISECLEYRKNFCCGWNEENYSSINCIWKCLEAPETYVNQDIEVLCRSELQVVSELVREVCRKYKELWVIE